jgi:hypothetical protein
VCDLETSRIGAPYIYDISHLKVNYKVIKFTDIYQGGELVQRKS